MRRKITTTEMEITLASYFDYRKNLVVPNISWGLRLNNKPLHECDLLILTNAGYLWEVEIKISKADLLADKKKYHGHYHPAIRKLYFAIPEYLALEVEHIPQRAGIIIVETSLNHWCNTIRDPVVNEGYKLEDHEKFKMAKLGAMRIWGLKSKLI